MLAFIKRNLFIIIIFLLTVLLSFITFLTFIDRSFIELNQNNLQYLLISNIFITFSLLSIREIIADNLESLYFSMS